MSFSDWAPFVRPLATTIAISAEEIRLDFPAGRYTVDEPVVLVTVSGGPTEVTVSSPAEEVGGLGEVHTHVVLTFPPELIGLRAAVWVANA